MSHVDEGTLHAYLDNELPGGERAALEAHLAECAACRARLAEERMLVERAGAVLGLARPPERATLPPLRSAKAPPLLWRLRVPLAWAASVVLALGIGYYAGEWEPSGISDLELTRVDSPAPAPAADRGVLEPAAPARERTPTTPRRDTPPPQPAPMAGAAPPPPPPPPPPIVVRGAAELAGAQAADRARAEGRDSVTLADASRRVRPLEEVVVTLDGSRAPGERLDVDQARALLGTAPVEVPGLDVRSIRRTQDGGGVVVEQELDGASVIHLIQRPAAAEQRAQRNAAPSAAAAPAYGQRASEQLARFIGSLRVEIAGPLGMDSLNRLLERVRPIGVAKQSAQPPR